MNSVCLNVRFRILGMMLDVRMWLALIVYLGLVVPLVTGFGKEVKSR